MSGFASSYVPAASDTDTLIAYLQRNALGSAAPGELGDDAETRFYIKNCSLCHETPSPAAHTSEEWESVIARMQVNMLLMDVAQLDDSDRDRILAYLLSREER